MTVDELFKTAEEAEEFAFREAPKAVKPQAQAVKPQAQAAKPQAHETELELENEFEPNLQPPPQTKAATPTGLSEAQLEKIIRAQSAEVIESVVWKVVPELATQIIERELNRLLKERDSHP